MQIGDGVQHNVGRDQHGVASPDAPNAPANEHERGAPTPLVYDVRVERDRDGYVAIADASTGGSYRHGVTVPVTAGDLERFEAALRTGDRRDIGVTAGSAVPAAAPLATDLGRRLFQALFTGPVLSGLRHVQARADDGAPVRIHLRLDGVPELAALPWELLRDVELDRVLALSNRTPLIRDLGVGEPLRRVPRRGALRILVLAASPSDLAPLAVEQEWVGLQSALALPVGAGRIELRRVDPPTLDSLGRALLDGPWHVFHFVGHGGWTNDGEAALAVEGDGERSRPVTAATLAMVLGDSVELRLAVLNACHTARGTDRQVLGGVAHGLLRQGLPVVVAMQFAISDAGAIAFAERLYTALATGMTVDRAVVEGRKVLANRGAEWVTPAVHQRGDGVVFDG